MPNDSDPSQLISKAMLKDQHALRDMLRGIRRLQKEGKPADRLQGKFDSRLQRSVNQREQRAQWRPTIHWDEELPVTSRRNEIREAITAHQTVILCGETGSGKSTQLPKILTEMGRGVDGLIGHTQPRRIAARSVAVRIAEELGCSVGDHVGYRIRFRDVSRDTTRILLMTDGILLAETQSDRLLEKYDTLIIDEAHERSLNIDFLLGYLKRLLPRRPDFRLIITSATIDAERFSQHFASASGPAPVIQVSGRTYPVEIRYRSSEEEDADGEDADERTSRQDALVNAVDELAAIDAGHILVFLPSERDIRETADLLSGRYYPGDTADRQTEIITLFGRLSLEDQSRVFSPFPHRRIVLATNVAESSLTVPGIRYVVDTGTARISRYSARSRLQRLPVEPISQASAAQRAGRCGRVGPGICIRLYSEQDFNSREPFTAPEILRTNLASVILRTRDLQLGRLEDFPFLDPPRPSHIREGIRTLEELGAIIPADSETTESVTRGLRGKETERQRSGARQPLPGELTTIGRRMAGFPVDPRISRILLAAVEENSLPEVAAIASFLEVQDPRERPADRQQAADQAHQIFRHRESDFLTILNLWDAWHDRRASLSGSQLKKWCRRHFLSWLRMREWMDVHQQLLEILRESDEKSAAEAAQQLMRQHRERRSAKQQLEDHHGSQQDTVVSSQDEKQRPTQGRQAPFPPAEKRHNDYDAVHRALMTGLLTNLAMKKHDGTYTGTGGQQLHLWPGSALFPKGTSWLVAAELVETSRRYARTIARIQPQWIEPIAAHLLKTEHFEPHWDSASGNVMVCEKVMLQGLTIVARRKRLLSAVDPPLAREMLIRFGLVEFGLLFGRLPDEEGTAKYAEEEEAFAAGESRLWPGRSTNEIPTAAGWPDDFPFLKHNHKVLQELEDLQARSRTQQLLPSDEELFAFYESRVPADCGDRISLRKWYRQASRGNPELLQFDINDFADKTRRDQQVRLFPESAVFGSLKLPLSYQLDPGRDADGVTLTLPVEALGQVSEKRLEWLVPGLLEQKVLALIRCLPKVLRRHFVPAPETAALIAADLEFAKGDLLQEVAGRLSRLCGESIPIAEFSLEQIPDHLRFNIRVLSDDRAVIAEGRDPVRIREQAAVSGSADQSLTGPSPEEKQWHRTGFRAWDFADLPESVAVSRAGMKIRAFPALQDDGDSVSLTLLSSSEESRIVLRQGMRRLFLLTNAKRIRNQLNNLPGLSQLRLQASSIRGIQFNEEISLLMAERAFLPDAGIPRSGFQFEQYTAAGQQRLGVVAQELTQFLPLLFRRYHDTRRALEQTRGPGWQEILQSLRQQVSELMHPQLFSSTPWPWLIQVPRYLAAVQQRLQRLNSGGLRAELAMQDRIEPLAELIQEVRQRLERQNRRHPMLEHAGWLLQEFRVQVCAQKLGTAVSVSSERIEEVLASIS